MRLIDADELAKAFREESEADVSKDNRTYWSEALISVAEDVDDALTVDAVPVVRCKDCKHYHKADRGHPDTEWCKRLICGTIKPDFFCADGERRSE